MIAALALAAPVGIAVVSAVSTDTLAARNLAVSWPAFALALAALLVWAPQPLRIASVGLVVAGLGVGAVKMLESKYQRADYDAAAAFIDRHASAGDVVIDAAIFSPGPLTGLEVALDQPHQVFRMGSPQERDHPFMLGDRVAPPAEVADRAVAAARGGRLFIVTQSDGAQRYASWRAPSSASSPGRMAKPRRRRIRASAPSQCVCMRGRPDRRATLARRRQRLAARTTLWAHTRRRSGVRSAARSAVAAAPSRARGVKSGTMPS